jgi:hypothetical protein
VTVAASDKQDAQISSWPTIMPEFQASAPTFTATRANLPTADGRRYIAEVIGDAVATNASTRRALLTPGSRLWQYFEFCMMSLCNSLRMSLRYGIRSNSYFSKFQGVCLCNLSIPELGLMHYCGILLLSAAWPGIKGMISSFHIVTNYANFMPEIRQNIYRVISIRRWAHPT